MKALLQEAARPWKLATFSLGLAALIYGAFTQGAMDWDTSISIIMAAQAYLTAPTAVRALKRFVLALRQRSFDWGSLLLGLLLVWAGSDGNYWCYWSIVDPHALEMMRAANAPASALLFLLCGFLWMHEGDLRSLVRLHSKPGAPTIRSPNRQRCLARKC